MASKDTTNVVKIEIRRDTKDLGLDSYSTLY